MAVSRHARGPLTPDFSKGAHNQKNGCGKTHFFMVCPSTEKNIKKTIVKTTKKTKIRAIYGGPHIRKICGP